MVKNERGSTLLIVLLMTLIFTILGLSILSASIGGAKRTELRENEVIDNLAAIKKLNEAVAFIRSTINTNYTPDMSLTAYNDLIENKIVSNTLGYQIKNIRTDLNSDFTRVLQVTSQNYKQNVYITGMPSFLKYALGSRDHLTLNGSVYLKEGNLYANTGITISNTARYIYNNNKLEIKTSFPSVYNKEKSLLFLEQDNINYCANNCYSGDTVNSNNFHSLPITELTTAFEPTAPTYTKEKTDFVEVNIIKTFLEKLKDGGFDNTEIMPTNPSDDEILNKINQAINTGSKNSKVKIIDKITNEPDITNPINIIDNTPDIKGYLYQKSPAYIDTNNLKVDKSKWLVIDGDAYFENIGSETMDISANILVTGNVYMKGNLAFDSTMYVLGDTIINNVDISGLNRSELILMTQKNLELARVNKFINPDSSSSSIKAYLYTASDANVYAIGSYIQIEGGLFAGGDLEVNAFRGETKAGSVDLDFTPDPDVNSSRLIMKNNKTLFIEQAQGLPKVEKLEVLTDLMKKE